MTTTKLFSTPTSKPSQFWFLHWNKAKFDPLPHNYVKPISTIHTKTKSSSMLTLKPIDFRPAYQSPVNFDHPHKKLSQSIPTLKTSHFRPVHKSQVNLDPHAKNQVNFDPYIKTKYFSIRTQKPKSILTPAQKTIQVRSRR